MWQGRAVLLDHFKKIVKHCFVGSLFFCAAIAAAANKPANLESCQASNDYIATLEATQSYQLSAQDFSCVSDIPSVQPQVASYQLIDIRAEQENISPLPNAWQMSVAQLKHKAYLKKRPLLLIGASFSRADGARECAILKQAGFEKVKFLAGGYDAWLSMANQKKRGVNQSTSKVVTAQEVLFEYFNSKVVLIASTPAVVDLLDQIGLKEHHFSPSFSSHYVTNIATEKSGGGFHPVVIVHDDASDMVSPTMLPNVYVLEGGIASLVDQSEKNRLANIARHESLGKFACENP